LPPSIKKSASTLMTAGRTRVLIPKSNVSLKNWQANENQNHQKFAAKI